MHRANQTPTNSALTGTHLLLGGEKQLWLSVLLKDTISTVVGRIQTHIPMIRPSGHTSTPRPSRHMQIQSAIKGLIKWHKEERSMICLVKGYILTVSQDLH